MIRRFVRVAVGLALAIAGGIVVFAAALIMWCLLHLDARWIEQLFGLASVFVATSDPSRTLDVALRAAWTAIQIVCCAPVIVTALIGEAARVHSLIWCVGATGGLTAVLPILMYGGQHQLSPAEQSLTLVCAIVGGCAGLIYWMIAGHDTEDRALQRKKSRLDQNPLGNPLGN